MDQVRFLSLGFGRQSTALLAMIALGELPPVYAAIHADTGWEHQATYEIARFYTLWAEERGVKVVTVNDYAQSAKVTTASSDIPFFTLDEDGKEGIGHRACTDRWKKRSQELYIKQVMGELGTSKRAPKAVGHIYGISFDEFSRMRTSDKDWEENLYPLVDMKMTANDCENYLRGKGLPVPPRSSCVFCPYTTERRFKDLKRAGGLDWEVAVMVDELLRDARPPRKLFVFSRRIPLNDISIAEDFGVQQLPMIEDDDGIPCNSGHCFL